MKAIGFARPQPIDQPDALVDLDIVTPVASGRDLLVQVKAISVNPVDTKVRKNSTHPSGEHRILGWDAVGEVVAVGNDVDLFKVGDTVWYAGDLTRPGSNAEYQLVDERIVALKPTALSNAEAAALPLTAITAWELLFDRLGFEPNFSGNLSTSPTQGSILIVGAAGGVGSILTQLAVTLTQAQVIGTASRTESQQWVKNLGAHLVIDHSLPLRPQLEAAGITHISHIISLTHTDQHFTALADLIAPQGKFALIDDPQTPLDIKLLKQKSASLHWEFMFTRAMFGTEDMQKQHELLTHVARLIDEGKLRSTLGDHYGTINATNLKRAHAQLESNATVGKIVLEGF